MSKRIVVDPITRIEGHLTLDAETNSEDGAHGSSHPSTISNKTLAIQQDNPQFRSVHRLRGSCREPKGRRTHAIACAIEVRT